MNFFDALNDAANQNSGLLMLAGLSQASSIAESQRQMVAHQKAGSEQAEAHHRLLAQQKQAAALAESQREEEFELQKAALAAAVQELRLRHQRELELAERERERQQAEGRNLNRFRGLLVYCQLLLEQADPYGYSLATLEVLLVSLAELSKNCSSTTDDLERYQRLRQSFHAAKTQWIAERRSTSCVAAAIRRLSDSQEALAKLVEVYESLQKKHDEIVQRCYTAASNPDLLKFLISLAGPPLNSFQLDQESLAAAQKRVVSSNGLYRCTDQDRKMVLSEVKQWNSEVQSGISEAMRQHLEQQTSRADQDHDFSSECSTSTAGNEVALDRSESSLVKDRLLSVSFSEHITAVAMPSSMRAFLGMLQQVDEYRLAQSEGPEYSGFQTIFEHSLVIYRRFREQLIYVDQLARQSRLILQQWQALVQGELPESVQVGLRKLDRINQQTLARQKAEKDAEKTRRLEIWKNGRSKTVKSRKSSDQSNSRFDHIRQRRQSKVVQNYRSRQKPDSNQSVRTDSIKNRESLSNNSRGEYVTPHAIGQLSETYETCLAEYRKCLTPEGKLLALQTGCYPDLDSCLRDFHSLVKAIPIPCEIGVASQVGSMIKEIQVACELSGLCLSWPCLDGGPEETISELVSRLRPRDITPASAYIEALCAIAAADGDFCSQERWTVKKWIQEAGLRTSFEADESVIANWCQLARDQNLSKAIAQSIVDCEVLVKTPLAAKLMQGLSAVLRVNGKASAAELEVFQAIKGRVA